MDVLSSYGTVSYSGREKKYGRHLTIEETRCYKSNLTKEVKSKADEVFDKLEALVKKGLIGFRDFRKFSRLLAESGRLRYEIEIREDELENLLDEYRTN